ncbi:MAG: shikimate dehydrogenase [Ilumatobacteraceae bacterium]
MIRAATRLAVVVGAPVAASLSPAIHAAAFAAAGADWAYGAVRVRPGGMPGFVRAMRALPVSGASVTMPHKAAAAALADLADDDVRLLGAANTLSLDAAGRIRARSTDGEGARDALAAAGASIAGARAVVIGAGGTAASVVLALARAGAEVAVVNRTAARAAELARAVSGAVAGARVRAAGMDAVGDADVVVHATPVGMGADESPVPRSAWRAGQTVLDAVYHPLDTRALREARAAGATVVDGLEMLVRQAALQQREWIDRTPDVAAMRRAATDELARRRTNSRGGDHR